MTEVVAKKLKGLDAVRGIAAILVFLLHFWILAGAGQYVFLGTDVTSIFASGGFGLDIFFVLSGFLIYRSIYYSGVNKKYFYRRLLRIVPIYYFSLFVVVVFLNPELMKSLSGLWNIVSHLLFLQSFSVGTYYGINPVLWSLSIEMIFYMFLPIFFLLTGRKEWKIVVGVIVMIAIAYFYRYSMMQYYGGWNATERLVYTENFIGRLDQFAFGIMSSYLVMKFVGRKEMFTKIVSLLLMLGAILGFCYGGAVYYVLQATFRDIAFYQVFLHSIVALSAAVFIFGLVTTFESVESLVGNRFLRWVGTVSYSFYIWHVIVTERIVALDISLLWKFIVSFVCILGISSVTYYFVEKPFLKLKKY